MKRLAILLTLTACGTSQPYTPEMHAVRSVGDTSNCRYVGDNTYTGLPGKVQNVIKRDVSNRKANRFKIVSSRTESAWVKDDVERVHYEIYDCPE